MVKNLVYDYQVELSGQEGKKEQTKKKTEKNYIMN